MASVRQVFGLFAVAAILATAGCAVVGHDGGSYQDDKFLDAREPSYLGTVGIESHDLQAACNQAVGKLLAEPLLASAAAPPVFVVEEDHFEVEDDSEVHAAALVALLRSELVDAADGRVRVVRGGNEMATKADYALGGSVTAVSHRVSNTTEKYTQVAFEVTDMHTHEVVFTDLHAFKKVRRSSGPLGH